MLELLKVLMAQKVTVVIVILGCVLIFFAVFSVDVSKGVVQPQTRPARTPLLLGVGAVILATLASVVAERGHHKTSSSDAHATLTSGTLANAISTTWYSEWRLGPKERLYKETLQLLEQSNGRVSGTRWTESADGAKEYCVAGFARGGFFWLEYHDEKDRGGGTLLLHEFTSGRLRGLITAANCVTGRIRCIANQWVPKTVEQAYSASVQQPIGEI
jgi:hypothetical protein